MQASSPGRSSHGTLTVRLNLEQLNRTIGKTQVNALSLNKNLTRAERNISRRSIKHAHGLAGNHATSGRGIGRSKHMTHAIKRRHVRIQTHLLLGNLGSMGDKRLILFRPHSGAIGKRRKRIGKQLAAQLTKLHRKRLGMLAGNRRGSLSTISTGINAMSNTHNGNASNLITSKNGTLNRSRATPTRQQGRMNIHNTKRRHMQHLIRQNATIGSHTENISLLILKRLNNLRRHPFSLNNRQPQLQCLSLNRRRLKLLTTPTNSIRTSNNKRNLIASLNKRNQRRHRKIRRTHKHNTHKTDPSKPKPKRLKITAPGQVPTKTPDQFNTFKYTQKQRKDCIKSSPLNKANISEDAHPWPDGTRERRAKNK